MIPQPDSGRKTRIDCRIGVIRMSSLTIRPLILRLQVRNRTYRSPQQFSIDFSVVEVRICVSYQVRDERLG
jgi:hypothetical protein